VRAVVTWKSQFDTVRVLRTEPLRSDTGTNGDSRKRPGAEGDELGPILMQPMPQDALLQRFDSIKILAQALIRSLTQYFPFRLDQGIA